MGRVHVEGPGRSEQLVARGEEGEELSLGKYLSLVFVSSDDPPARYKAGVELAKLVRARGGSVRLRFGALRGPAGTADVKVDLRREALAPARAR